jgi:DNA-binding CsgD family transcriptional regulator
MSLDINFSHSEGAGPMALALSPERSPLPIVTWFDTRAVRAPGWSPEVQDVRARARRLPSARCRHFVLRTWSALAAMKLSEGQERIVSMEALFDGCHAEDVELERLLLRATGAALDDDAETAGALIGEALKAHDDAAVHPVSLLLLRMGHWKARRLDAFCEFSRSVDHVPTRRRDALLSILHLSMESAVEAEQLRLVTAGRLAHEALELSARLFGQDFPGCRMAAALSASILYEHNQIDAADRLIRDRLVLSGSQGGIEGALRTYIVGARIAVTRQQVPFAVLLLREAEFLGEERGWPRLVAASLAERVRLLVEDGRLTGAEDCARRLASMQAETDSQASDSLLSCEVAIAHARLELTTGASASAASSLRRIVVECLERRELHRAVELQMLLACILRGLGREDEAASEALSAIERGATAGLYRTFLDGGEPTRDLLGWLFERRTGHFGVLGELRPYVGNLLIGFPVRTKPPATARTRHRSGESLSPRERHILTLISHGLSNKRIAKELDIAPETVKSHAKHILLKLAAQTRVEAVSRAHSLGII